MVVSFMSYFIGNIIFGCVCVKVFLEEPIFESVD